MEFDDFRCYPRFSGRRSCPLPRSEMEIQPFIRYFSLRYLALTRSTVAPMGPSDIDGCDTPSFRAHYFKVIFRG